MSKREQININGGGGLKPKLEDKAKKEGLKPATLGRQVLTKYLNGKLVEK